MEGSCEKWRDTSEVEGSYDRWKGAIKGGGKPSQLLQFLQVAGSLSAW